MKIEYEDNLFNKEEKENTPERIERFHKEWAENANFKFTVFDNPGYDQMIICKDIDFASLCSHHLLPFKGRAHIGYIPDKKICGLSKLARTVDAFASKPQLQEGLTEDITSFISDKLKPLGLMVVLDAAHDCMRIRGVKKPNSTMVTSSVKGVFRDKPQAREEFLRLIK
jgi:GTP cyclohydrolase I